MRPELSRESGLWAEGKPLVQPREWGQRDPDAVRANDLNADMQRKVGKKKARGDVYRSLFTFLILLTVKLQADRYS